MSTLVYAQSGEDLENIAGIPVVAEPVPVYGEPERMYYGTWNPPEPYVIRRHDDEADEAAALCLCFFLCFIFFIFVISIISYYTAPFDDDYYYNHHQ